MLIGRNEGARLDRALRAVRGQLEQVVYVDSGSTDGSVAFARSVGAEVVELDTSRGFSAARARDAGLNRLLELDREITLVQFIDGDCEIVPGWLEHARAAMAEHDDVAVVCGRRRERHPENSVYNRLIDLEWDTPVGEAKSCGGDALYRVTAYRQAGGFDPTVTAGEEPELCRRMRAEGWRVLRLNHEMTLHDADMRTFKQWWLREVRSGYGAMDVYMRTRKDDPLFADQVLRTRHWTLVLLCACCVLSIGVPILLLVLVVHPLVGLIGFFTGPLVFIALHVLQWFRERKRFLGRGVDAGDTRFFATLSLLGKWGQMVGQIRWRNQRMLGRGTSIIEYKSAEPVSAKAGPGLSDSATDGPAVNR